MINALKIDNIDGFIVQNPFQMGYQGVHAIYKAMKGNEIENNIDTKVVFVNKKNITDANIKTMLGLK